MHFDSQQQPSNQRSSFRKYLRLGLVAFLASALGVIFTALISTAIGASPDNSFSRSIAQSQVAYHQFDRLNQGSVDVGSTWTKLNTTSGEHTFTKGFDDTNIEVHINSRFSVNELDANGILIQVRIDDELTAQFENLGSLTNTNSDEFQSIFAVFTDLPAGEHSVSLWAEAVPDGTATGVFVDPGGWDGRIIVNETP